MKKLSYIWVNMVNGCFNFAHCFFFKDSANIPQLFVAVRQYEAELDIHMLFFDSRQFPIKCKSQEVQHATLLCKV